MKQYKYLILLFFTNLSFYAQIKCVVKDSLTKEVIPFATIYIENTNQSLVTNGNGAFLMPNFNSNSMISITSVGYQKKKILIKNNIEILLKPIVYELQEVSVSNKVKNKTLEIGLTKDKYLQAFENGSKFEIKFFPYLQTYKKINYIKSVAFHTENKIEKATFKIHFYTVGPNGLPEKDMLDRDCIVTVKKGTRKTTFNMLYLNLQIPSTGIFVGFEKLHIESNQYEKKNFDGTQIRRSYNPNIFYNRVEKMAQFVFSEEKWNKKSNKDGSSFIFNEPAIYLTLTN